MSDWYLLLENELWERAKKNPWISIWENFAHWKQEEQKKAASKLFEKFEQMGRGTSAMRIQRDQKEASIVENKRREKAVANHCPHLKRTCHIEIGFRSECMSWKESNKFGNILSCMIVEEQILSFTHLLCPHL